MWPVSDVSVLADIELLQNKMTPLWRNLYFSDSGYGHFVRTEQAPKETLTVTDAAGE